MHHVADEVHGAAEAVAQLALLVEEPDVVALVEERLVQPVRGGQRAARAFAALRLGRGARAAGPAGPDVGAFAGQRHHGLRDGQQPKVVAVVVRRRLWTAIRKARHVARGETTAASRGARARARRASDMACTEPRGRPEPAAPAASRSARPPRSGRWQTGQSCSHADGDRRAGCCGSGQTPCPPGGRVWRHGTYARVRVDAAELGRRGGRRRAGQGHRGRPHGQHVAGLMVLDHLAGPRVAPARAERATDRRAGALISVSSASVHGRQQERWRQRAGAQE